MTTKTMQEIRQEVEQRKASNDKKFIPMEGTENDIYVFPDDPVVVPEGEYTFYQFRVRHMDKEKTMRLFDNQAVEMDDALKKHKDRNIHVSRGKGSKKIVFS